MTAKWDACLVFIQKGSRRDNIMREGSRVAGS